MTDKITPELSRILKFSDFGSAPIKGQITGSKEERLALAKRFDLPEIRSLSATYTLVVRDEIISFAGTLKAKLDQLCSISGKAFPVEIDEQFNINFAEKSNEPPAQDHGDEGFELAEEDCDLIEYEGAQIDLGEAIAQTLYLSLDPYPRGPEADIVAAEQGLKSEEEAGPFGALAGLKDKLEKKL